MGEYKRPEAWQSDIEMVLWFNWHDSVKKNTYTVEYHQNQLNQHNILIIPEIVKTW